MATYDYLCETCETVTEIVHSMMDDSERLCEHCQKPMKKLISASGVVYKGSGWSKVDRRGNGTDIVLK